MYNGNKSMENYSCTHSFNKYFEHVYVLGPLSSDHIRYNLYMV